MHTPTTEMSSRSPRVATPFQVFTRIGDRSRHPDAIDLRLARRWRLIGGSLTRLRFSARLSRWLRLGRELRRIENREVGRLLLALDAAMGLVFFQQRLQISAELMEVIFRLSRASRWRC